MHKAVYGLLFIILASLVPTFYVHFGRTEPPMFEVPYDHSLEQDTITKVKDGKPVRIERSIIDENMSFLMSPAKISVEVNETFIIQVDIENVTDMFGWQVYLHFDQRFLECLDVRLPFDHVLSYGVTVGGALVEYNATEFTDPLYRIRNDEGRMLAGNCLLGSNQSTFYGSGTLCQIQFKAITKGSSIIKLRLYSNFSSFILNSEIASVKPSTNVCSVVTCSET